jgi:hypothetical protein
MREAKKKLEEGDSFGRGKKLEEGDRFGKEKKSEEGERLGREKELMTRGIGGGREMEFMEG